MVNAEAWWNNRIFVLNPNLDTVSNVKPIVYPCNDGFGRRVVSLVINCISENVEFSRSFSMLSHLILPSVIRIDC